MFGDPALTNVIVDRLTHKTTLIDMEGESYRLREMLRSNGTFPIKVPDAMNTRVAEKTAVGT